MYSYLAAALPRRATGLGGEVSSSCPKSSKLGITLENVHAPDVKSKKPLIKVFNSSQYANRPNPSVPSCFKCLLCIKLGLDVEGDTEDKVVAHIIKL